MKPCRTAIAFLGHCSIPILALARFADAMPGLGSSRRLSHFLMSIINGYDATILEYAIVMVLNGYDQSE
jgi:hypothetical protein